MDELEAELPNGKNPVSACLRDEKRAIIRKRSAPKASGVVLHQQFKGTQQLLCITSTAKSLDRGCASENKKVYLFQACLFSLIRS